MVAVIFASKSGFGFQLPLNKNPVSILPTLRILTSDWVKVLRSHDYILYLVGSLWQKVVQAFRMFLSRFFPVNIFHKNGALPFCGKKIKTNGYERWRILILFIISAIHLHMSTKMCQTWDVSKIAKPSDPVWYRRPNYHSEQSTTCPCAGRFAYFSNPEALILALGLRNWDSSAV